MPAQWKETAWSGVRFQTPVDWEIAKIGKQYILFEDEDRPVLEIKWNAIKGSFSHKKHLRRLTSLHGKKAAYSITEWKIPNHWESVLKKYDAYGFSWESGRLYGNGAILYCPECGTATIIQFFFIDREIDLTLAARIFKTFRDHDSREQALWSIYDIRAHIPKTFKLERYRFEPGHFLLVFISARQQISLHRWSPAHILLTEINLPTFAVSRVPKLSRQQLSRISKENSLEWESCTADTAWSRWRNRIRKQSSYQWGRIWHEKKKNRILAIQIEDQQPDGKALLQDIYEGYESF